MIFTLLSHEWKSFWRARNAGAQVVIQILIGLAVLYFLLLAIAGAFFLAEELEKLFPNQDVVVVFCGFILYYFAFDILARFQLQELPTLIVQPYLIQDIRRNQLVNFLNVRSLFSLFNLLPFILGVPFLILRVLPHNGVLAALALITGILSLTVFNHFIIMLVKRKTTVNSLWSVGFLALLLALGASDYFHLFSIRTVSASLFMSLLRYPSFCLLALVLATSAFYVNRAYLIRNLYLEDIVKSSKQRISTEYVWLNRFGSVGELLGNDIKLILRNKRLRAGLGTSVIFLFYGFFFYKHDAIEKEKLGTLLLGSTFVTGVAISQFSILIFSSQCSFFDGLMTANLPMRNYVRAKLILLTSLSTLALLPALFYGIISWKIIPILIAAYLFNIGISSVIYLYAATFNHKAIDISKTAMFNQRGSNVTQIIYPLMVGVIGLIVYWPFAFFINAWAGVAAIGLAGLISFLLRDRWLHIITSQLLTQKYKMLEGFREK